MAEAVAKSGSARILERLGRSDTISEGTLKGIIEVARRHDVKSAFKKPVLGKCRFC
jgi:hypothetical protein